MSLVLKGYLRLMRPANLPTAAADILAGIAIAGAIPLQKTDSTTTIAIFFLVAASVLLYAGGVVLNDVFDHKIDAIERPERPIPSGLISLKSAAFFGGILLVLGICSAFLVDKASAIIAILLALSIISYDGFSKKYSFLGPFNMGLCRSLNLALGMSVFGHISNWWYLAVPLVYIFAITLISRGEVHGDNKKHILWAAILYALVIFSVVSTVIVVSDRLVQVIPFLLLFAYLIFKPLVKAFQVNSPENIKKAVIGGVLSLIVLDAAWATGFSEWWYGLLILLLLPLSMLLSKLFAVT